MPKQSLTVTDQLLKANHSREGERQGEREGERGRERGGLAEREKDSEIGRAHV